MQEDVGFSKHGTGFQESLAQLIFEDRSFSEQMEEVLDVNFFELKYLKVFVKKIFDYRQKYGSHPTKKVMSSILNAGLEEQDDAVKKQIQELIHYWPKAELASKVLLKES